MSVPVKPLLIGLQSYLPGRLGRVGQDLMRGAGGTASARYCYSVWLRHLVMAHEYGLKATPEAVAELGPGGSVGTGYAALLTGARRYYALDAVLRASNERNQLVWTALQKLFRGHEPIPDQTEFPRLKPILASYAFPHAVLTKPRLDAGLSNPAPNFVQFICPWEQVDALPPSSVDWIISQAVLEHVNDLDLAYRAMATWLRPDGVMSHQIDFKSHQTADAWDGHWTYRDFTWHMIRGRRPYLINREPLSTHLRLLCEYGFEVIHVQRVQTESTLRRPDLASRFRRLNDEDLTTSGAYILAVRR
jgi:hypothetical protein